MRAKFLESCCLIPLLLAAATSAQQPPSGPGFTSVQPDLFGMPGSLSNAWADFDRDGDLDFAVSLKSGEIRVYRNDGGTFASVGGTMGLPTGGYEFRALDWGDYDGDGWLDLFAGATNPKNNSALFHNLGGKRFTDVASAVGLAMPGRSARQNNWVDYDNDGDVDLYATDRIGANKLYRNDDGRFAQAFANAGPTDARSTVGACWLDYDEDGDLDVFLANQSGKTDALWRNDRDRFTDVAPQLHMDTPGRAKDEGGVGCAVGDYDNDGHLDIFVPNYGRNGLWHNNGDGTFSNTAEAAGVAIENHAVGAAWGDYDNDGFIDLAVMSYHGETPNQVPFDAFFHNNGGKGFSNLIGSYPLLNAGDHGVEWADYNNDGALDLSETRGYSAVGGHLLFRNDLSPAAARRSLRVLVLDAKGHYTQAGAVVRLYDAKRKLLGTGQVSTGGGYGAQSAQPVHFGLPNTATVTVEVTFMSNAGPKVQRLRNVAIGKYAGRGLAIRRAV